MNSAILLAAVVALGLAQVWTKPIWLDGKSVQVYGIQRTRWSWTFLILWIALAVVVAWDVVSLFFPLPHL